MSGLLDWILVLHHQGIFLNFYNFCLKQFLLNFLVTMCYCMIDRQYYPALQAAIYNPRFCDPGGVLHLMVVFDGMNRRM